MAATPKSSRPWARALLHSVYDQPGAASVHAHVLGSREHDGVHGSCGR